MYVPEDFSVIIVEVEVDFSRSLEGEEDILIRL